MTAINSHVIVPIARDCARAGGDIWVLYIGNNEVVGPFGAGTVFGAQALPAPWVRAELAWKATRVGQMLDEWRQAWQKPPPDKSEWGGMEMFLEQQVRADDPRMSGVYRNFQRNLADIIRLGRQSGAGVVVSTVAVNLKDCAPFGSEHRGGLSGAEDKQLEESMRLGIQAQAAGKISEALAQLRQAAQLDPSNAELEFRLGRCLLAAQDRAGAGQALKAARDLDTLRFRCDSVLNQLIRKTASDRQGQRVLLADAEAAFGAASPERLPGWEMFYEHVHLTFQGNCLLARVLAEQIEKLLPADAAAGAWPTAADCARRLGRTERDEGEALADILGRMADAPFTSQINHQAQVQYLTQQARKAGQGTTVAEALGAAQAAEEEAPEEAELYEHLAALERAAGHRAQAEAAARRAVELLPSSEDGWTELGFAFVDEQKYEQAAHAFQQAFELDPGNVLHLHNLATALVYLGRKEEAMAKYKQALAIMPRFGMAWLGIGQILEGMGQKEAAADCFRKALQNRINRAADLANLARFCMSRGWLEAACTNYADALMMDPADPGLPTEAGKAHFLYGIELGKSGKLALAARQFQEAVRLLPELVEARLNLGIAFYQEGKWDVSLHEFEQVAARNPTNAVAQHYLALLRQKLGPQGGQPP